MATLIATADGNLTGATTFAAAEVGAGALVTARLNIQGLSPNGTTASTAFTVTNGKVIDGVVLWMCAIAGVTGTTRIELQKGGVSQCGVTINKTDVPVGVFSTITPLFFKFTSTATGDGGSNWTIAFISTGTGTMSAAYSVSTTNFTHILRTTTTQAPAAADDLYIVGELTGAGTHNSRTVTMDSTAATAYGNGAVNTTSVAGGGIHISNWGTLTYGAATVTGGDPYWSSTKLLLSFDGANNALSGPGFTDASPAAHGDIVSNTGSNISTTQSVFGGSSLQTNGTGGNSHYATHADWNLTNQPFTIELRFYMTGGSSQYRMLFGRWLNPGNLGWQIMTDSTNANLIFQVSTTGSDSITVMSAAVSANRWYALAVDFDGTKYRMYFDGVMVASSTTLYTIFNSTYDLTIGTTSGGASFYFGGYVDELRLTKAARYASDSGYTVATSAFPRTGGVVTGVPAAGTNYLMRVNGDVIVYQFGTLNMGSSQSASSYGTWNPADLQFMTLSNGNLTALQNNWPAFVRGNTGQSSGKYYFEYTVDVVGANIGVATTAKSAALTEGTGQILVDGGGTGVFIAASNNGDKIGVAVDVTNRLIWFRVAPSGNWNGNATYNPATGVGGVSISVLTGPLFTWVNVGPPGTAQHTLNAGATAFTGAVPSGFTSGWPAAVPASTAVLEFQQLSADGDFGLRCLDNSVVTITGQPRTAGKNVVKCKLTTDEAQTVVNSANVDFAGVSTVNAALESSGTSLLARSWAPNATNSAHTVFAQFPNLADTVQTATVWLARGGGTYNRYVRFLMGNITSATTVAHGFYSDIDLLNGTAGTVTAVGTGTATSVSITPWGGGFILKMTGKISTALPSSATASLSVCSAPGTLSFSADNTVSFIYQPLSVATGASADTTISVDADTGWLAGDVVCVASTTRTAAECELSQLAVNAGASSFTGALPLVFAHSGTAPTQAEIGLITRNVKIRSTSTTLMSYVYCTALSTVTASWAEFYYVGHASAANKRGIEIDAGAVANPKSLTYCSVHDTDRQSVFFADNAAASLNLVFSNNIVWNSLSGSAVHLDAPITNNDWTMDNNLVMRASSAVNEGGFYLADVGGVFTNNTATSCGNDGFEMIESNAVLGTFNNNVAHSNASGGMSFNIGGNNLSGTINNFTVWRNNGTGIFINGATPFLIYNNLVMFGNGAAPGNIRVTSTPEIITITGNSIIAGDTTYPSPRGFSIESAGALTLNLANVDMSGVGGILAPHTANDIHFISTTVPIRVNANNCKFGATTGMTTGKSTNWRSDAYMSFQKFNQTAGDHRTEMYYGQLRTDTSVFHTASPSMRMTPNNASNRLESAPRDKGMLVAVNSGDTVTAAVWVRKAANTDASSTWNPQDMSVAGISLINGNLTAINSTIQGVRGTTSQNAGKVYFEMKTDTANSGNSNAYGIASSTTPLINSTVGACVYNPFTGFVWYNGGGPFTNVGNATSAGSVVGCAVDFVNKRIWFRVNAGNWNGSAANNPATNVGGFDISAVFPAAPAYPFLTWNSGGNQVTANFGNTAFANAAPSGFSAWSSGATGVGYTGNQPRLIVRANAAIGINDDTVLATYGAGAGSWVQLTGTTIAATDAGACEFIVDCDGTSGFINIDDWSAS